MHRFAWLRVALAAPLPATLLITLPTSLVAGCGPKGVVCEKGDTRPVCNPDLSSILAIKVTPDDVLKEIDVDHQQSYSIPYRAVAALRSGDVVDVTNAALWTLDRFVGSFEANVLTTSTALTAGGIVKVRASLNGATGEAALVIKLTGHPENDGVGAGAFGGPPNTDPAAKPRIVYPLPDSIHARNIKQMTIQFFAGAGNQVFRARFSSPQMDYSTTFKPTMCDGDRCQWSVPEALWGVIALSNGGTTARMVLSGAAGGASDPVAQSDALALTFSPEDVKGGFYYFSTSLPGVVRLPLDAVAGTKATPFIVPNSPSNPQGCSGCHAISQDCRQMTATYGHGDEFLGITSAVHPEQFHAAPGTTRSNFQWFNPDGSRIISNFDGELILRDAQSGAELSRVAKSDIGPAGRDRAVMPEWSHDGKHIAFVRLVPESKLFYDCIGDSGQGGDWLLCNGGQIATIEYDAGGFGHTKVVVDIGESKDYHYYPTWSPDDQWIVFNSGSKPGFSPCAQGDGSQCGNTSYGVGGDSLVSYDQKTSRLRMVRATGGGVIELAKATVAAGTTASWPKFAPFMQKAGQLLFFTYSSKMDYGFVVTGGAQPQLWMSAVDLSRLGEASSDPSYAPAWLPFQDEREANHLGVWSTCVACDRKEDCPAEFDCLAGKCQCDPDKGNCGQDKAKP